MVISLEGPVYSFITKISSTYSQNVINYMGKRKTIIVVESYITL